MLDDIRSAVIQDGSDTFAILSVSYGLEMGDNQLYVCKLAVEYGDRYMSTDLLAAQIADLPQNLHVWPPTGEQSRSGE